MAASLQPAWGQSPQPLSEEFQAIESDLRKLETPAASKLNLETTLGDLVALARSRTIREIGDPNDAGLFLRFGHLESDDDEKNANEEVARERDYALAEATLALGSTKRARSLFLRLAQQAPDTYGSISLLRLAQSATETKEDTQVIALLRKLDAQALAPKSLYEALKAYWRQGQLAPIIAVEPKLKSLPSQTSTDALLDLVRIQHLIATAHTKAGQISRAQKTLEDVLTHRARDLPLTTEAQRLLDSVRLNAARLALELGDYEQSALHYAGIGPNSAAYGQALYESAWAKLWQAQDDNHGPRRRRTLREALNDLDELITTQASSFPRSDARLARSNVLLELRRYDDANDNFKVVHDDTRDLIDRLQHFRQSVIGRTLPDDLALLLSPLGGNLLPGFLSAAMREHPALQRALHANAALSQLATWQTDAASIAEQLHQALKPPHNRQLFTETRTLDHAMARLRQRWVTAEVERLLASGRHLRRYLPKGNAREQLQQAVLTLDRAYKHHSKSIQPDRIDPIRTQEQFSSKLDRQARRVQQLQWHADLLNEQIQGLRSWLQQNQRQLGGKQQQTVRDLLLRQQTELIALNKSLKQLRTDLDLSYRFAGLSMQPDGDVTAVIAALADPIRGVQSKIGPILKREIQVKDGKVVACAACKKDRKLRQLFNALEASTKAKTTLSMKTKALQEGVDKATGAVRREVDNLYRAVKDNARAMKEHQQQLRRMFDGAAIAAHQAVANRLTHLAERAALGSIDVVWAKKEHASSRWNKRSVLHERARRALDERYREILPAAAPAP